ncbi:hypothetical protein TWF106_007644 [Orbilia oligospora]|uniref:Zn(2)-C6 fungal-type domain-containing protein n=1 Tax=Orbilia oligospora TaxID=2813651 RepID=A0A7C8QMT2_ORBOL|nr:hypothetical protein TWF106_007644 [Orbilia oligospora]
MSRPANGNGNGNGNVYAITKLPSRKSASEEKEAMNCKSCRKRKIKCSRTRPKCNSCEVFHCECIYDAVPRKRGPKTELLEDLLRRIGHLEKRLEDGKGSGEEDKTSDELAQAEANGHTAALVTPPSATASHPTREEPGLKHEEENVIMEQELPELAPTPISVDMDANYVPHLVDVYFTRVNKKPHSYIHEKTFRGRIHDGSVPQHLLNAICATSIRYTLPPTGKTLAECAERFASLARNQVDADEPSVDNLLTLILLSDVYFALGHGKKSFMQLGSAIRMALALELHRELPPNSPATPVEREVRRRCFWTCYLMDRFAVCGSNRPPLISDCTIKLRLPCSESHFRSGKPSEESLFSEDGFGQQFGSIPLSRNTNAMLVEIVRILGKTVLYIQQGGVKGDSHFPWHSSSNLSMIRNELKVWAGYFENKAQEKASFPSGSEATCSTIRRIYMNHIRLSKGSPADIKYLDDFFDRYDDVTFDTAFIPFEFLNDFSVENLSSPDDLFADPTLSEIFHSPVPSVGTPQIPNASPSNTTDGGSASSITHVDEYGHHRHTKRPKIHRHSSVSDGSTPLNSQHSPQDQYRMRTRERLQNSHPGFHYPGQPPMGPQRSTSATSIPENNPFDFTSPVMPNTAYSYDMNKYTFSPSGNYSFFSSTPYNNFFDFGMDPAVFSADPSAVQEKDPLPTELEPDPLMTLLSEMATREDGNSLDMFMGNPPGPGN